MNILLVLQDRPQSQITGAWQRTYLMWEALQQLGEVYAVYYDNQNTGCPEHDRMKQIRMPKISRVLHYKLMKPLHKIRAIEFMPLKPLCKTIADVYPGVRFNLAVCRYIYNFANFHLWSLGAPVLIDIDDHPLQIYDTGEKKNVPKYLRGLGRKVLQWQIAYLEKKADGFWIANQEHRSLMSDASNVCLLKNIAPCPSSSYLHSCNPKRYLLTVGTMSYAPNYHGVTYFLNTIWPKFHIQHPDFEYVIAGKNAPEDMAAIWNSTPGVKYLGFVDDLEPLYSECTATVVPIDEGSGTCIKTLESLSHGVPCLSTQFGCRGIEYNGDFEDIGIYVYNDVSNFTASLHNILHTNDRHVQENRMQSYIAKNYIKENFFASVKELVNNVLKE